MQKAKVRGGGRKVFSGICPITNKETDKKDCEIRSGIINFNKSLCSGSYACKSPWKVTITIESGGNGDSPPPIEEVLEEAMAEQGAVEAAEGISGNGDNGNGNGGSRKKKRGRGIVLPVMAKGGRQIGGRSRTRVFKQDGVVITILMPTPEELNTVTEVPINCILPYKRQPRQHMRRGAIEALALSVKSRGQKQEVHFVKISGHPVCTHLLIDGHRRFESAKKAGGSTLRGVLKDVASERDLFLDAARANVFRDGLTPVDEAHLLADLKAEFGFTDAQAGAELGMHAMTAAKRLALLSFTPEFLALLEEERPDDKRLKLTVAADLKGLPSDLQRRMVEMVERGGKSMGHAIASIKKEAERRDIWLGKKKRGVKPSDVRASVMAFLKGAHKKAEDLRRLLMLKPGSFEGSTRVDLDKAVSSASTALTELRRTALRG